jgi:hypothetical protein
MGTDRLTFNRWLVRDFALRVDVTTALGRSGPVPLTYYYPYSGQTPRSGVTGSPVDLGTYPPASGYTAQGRSGHRPGARSLVRTAPSVFDLNLGQTASGGYEPARPPLRPPAGYTAYAAALTDPAWQGMFEPVPLLDARNAGVLDVNCAWTGMPDDEIMNEYNPFTTGYPAPSSRPTPSGPGFPGGDDAGVTA